MDPKDQDSITVNTSESLSHILSQAGIFLLGISLPLVLVYGFGAFWFWVVLGSFAWIVAFIFKITLVGISCIYLPSKWVKFNALISGVLSSVSELGIAAIFFGLYLPKSNALVNIVAFGVAAGCAEILFVLGAMYFEIPSAENVHNWIKGAKASFCVRYVLFIERSTALLGHVGSRGLVSLSLLSESYDLATIALLSFALTDGLAAYGNFKGWDWFDPITCRNFHGVCLSISTIEVMLFVVFSISRL